MPKIEVYDNNGETWDRYTVVIDGDLENCYGMSEKPLSYQGFNQYVGRVSQAFLDTQVKLDSIPACLEKAIQMRADNG